MMIKELTEDPKKILAKKSNAIVAFVTTWCDDCKRSMKYETTLSETYNKKIEFFRMNAEKYESIADIYGVQNYPTFVFFKNGTPTEKSLVEPLSEDEIKKWIKNILIK